MRVVPRENDAINETWIADGDRYSYEGIYSADRIESPMAPAKEARGKRSAGKRRSNAAKGLKAAGADLRRLASSSATVEARSARQDHARAGF